MSSSWVVHEITIAKDHGIPIITIIDVDISMARQIIDQHIEKGYGHLFDNQVINYSTSYRANAYRLVFEAVNAAVNDSAGQSAAIPNAVGNGKLHGDPSDQAHFVTVLLSRYSSVEEAWSAFDIKRKGYLSRSDFKRVIHKTLGLRWSDGDRRKLRGKLDPQNTNHIVFEAFAKFVRLSQSDGAENKLNNRRAVIPMDVPSLPDRFIICFFLVDV
jgi:hypothetical protein